MKKQAVPAIKIGPRGQKVLLLLLAGATLSLTSRPDTFFKVVKETVKEWRRINQRTLQRAIRNLYRSKLVGYQEHKDGLITLILTENGKKRALRYNLDKLSIKKPTRWDGWWRLVVFDIPERFRMERMAFASKLKDLEFYQMQKSVFISPYECRDEVDFVVELFELRPYVRFLLVKETDIDLALKHRFGLA